MKRITAAACIGAAFLSFAVASVGAQGVAIARSPDPTGVLIPSSWVGPRTPTDTDTFAYASFSLVAPGKVTGIRWRGGYAGGDERNRVVLFLITIYGSTTLDTEPFANNPYLEQTYEASYNTGGNADETPAGTASAVPMYDYRYEFSPPFEARANTRYWVKIEAVQVADPNWGIAAATGTGGYYRYMTSMDTFVPLPGDIAFSLLEGEAPALGEAPQDGASGQSTGG